MAGLFDNHKGRFGKALRRLKGRWCAHGFSAGRFPVDHRTARRGAGTAGGCNLSGDVNRFHERRGVAPDHEIHLGRGHRVLVHPAPERRPVRVDAARPLLAGRLRAGEERAWALAPALRAAVARDRTAAGQVRLVDAPTSGWPSSKSSGSSCILDVMHFGTPTWLKQAVGRPGVPGGAWSASRDGARRAVSRPGARRGARSTSRWCCALFSGDFGFWPPHARKWQRVHAGAEPDRAGDRAAASARSAGPSPRRPSCSCDNVENYKTRAAGAGRRSPPAQPPPVPRDGPAHRPGRSSTTRCSTWVTSYGLSELDLDWFRANPQTPDVLGLDYYPHSDWQLEHGPTARSASAAPTTPVGLYGIANAYYNRYGLPMMLTETSIDGPADQPRDLARDRRSTTAAGCARKACRCSATSGGR